MLGISVYPERASVEEIISYIDLANKYGFKRVFTCLLSAPNDVEQIKKDFTQIIIHARNYGMEVIVDTNPNIFDKLGISYDNLVFFTEIGATGVRLDLSFDGKKEAIMTHNPYDLKIECNMSFNNHLPFLICDYGANKNNLIGCHNFYPQRHTGLSLDYFIDASKKYRDLHLRTAAFVSSQVGKMGPWQITDGLPTLEMHRDMAIDTQTKHLYQLGLIDDIIIANQFASEEELKAMANIEPSVLKFKIHVNNDIDPISREILFKNKLIYRGDKNDYFIRTSEPRIEFGQEDIKPNNTLTNLKRGYVCIGNNNFGQYKAELKIVKTDVINENDYRNVVGYIDEKELFLIDLLKPWHCFTFEEV